MLGDLPADSVLHSVAGVVQLLVGRALKLHGVGADFVHKNLVLHMAVRRFQFYTLEVILGGCVDLVHGVANPVLGGVATLHVEILLHLAVVNRLDELTDQLGDVEAAPVHPGVDHGRAGVNEVG